MFYGSVRPCSDRPSTRFIGKRHRTITIRVSTIRGGFFQQASVNIPFAVDFSTKCSDHGLNVGPDHAWGCRHRLVRVDPVSRVGRLGVLMDRHEVVELLHWFTSVRNMPLHTHRPAHDYFHRVRARRHYITRGMTTWHSMPTGEVFHHRCCMSCAASLPCPCPSLQVVVTAQDPVLTKTEILFNGPIWKQLDEA